MADRTFILVCEGSSDLALLRALIEDAGRRLGKTFRVISLLPQVDATGTHEKNGWTGVKRWCLRNSRRLGALLAFQPADHILIHLDCDIAHELDDINKYDSRRDCCSTHLKAWLNISNFDQACHFILPTLQIETWLLATFDCSSYPAIFTVDYNDYEIIEDVEQKLLRLGYEPDRTKAGRIYKEHRLFWENLKYAPRLVANLPDARARCRELDQFCDFLDR